MSKKQSRDEKELEVEICRSVIKALPNDRLLGVQSFFDKLAAHKKVVKLYNTYIEGVETALKNTGNGRMYVNYNIDGTVTGRISNSGARILPGKAKEGKIGVSFHTLPREEGEFNIRDYVIAPEGWDFITVDMKAMELRVLAHVANERNMIKAFESKIDLHTYSASMVFNKDPKDVTKLERQIAKEVSFLTVYGGTAFTLANKRNISEAKADKIINNWMAAFPGVQKYMTTVEDYINQHKYAKTIFGRRRNLPNIDSPFKNVRREAFRQGLNFTVQSPASDILQCCMLGTIERFKDEKLRAKIIAEVHDSEEAISPREETKRAIQIIYDEMVNYHYLKRHFGIVLRVPLEVDIQVGTSFGNGKPYKMD